MGGVAVAVMIRNLGFQPITLSTPAVQLEVRDRRTGRVLALGRFDAPDAIQRLTEVGRGESVVEIARWSGELTTLDGRELAGRAAPGTYVIRASTQVLRPSLRRIVGDSAVVQLRATR